jgi:hypothetical protein
MFTSSLSVNLRNTREDACKICLNYLRYAHSLSVGDKCLFPATSLHACSESQTIGKLVCWPLGSKIWIDVESLAQEQLGKLLIEANRGFLILSFLLLIDQQSRKLVGFHKLFRFLVP